MSRRDTAPTGAPCWIDLTSSDTQASIEFYSRLFGWTAEDPAAEFGGYVNFRHDDVRIAGCMASQPDSGMPDQWSVYLATDDATKTVEAVTARGGQVIVPAMVVGDLGTMAVISDAGGAVVGLWQPGRHRGFGVLAEPGTPAWFELHTRDYDATLDFYREAFGWETRTVSDAPEFRYTTLTHGEEWLAGVMDATGMLASEVPAHWSVYFGVDDTDAALATAVELGGSVAHEPEDTPYGRLAAATDPTGAQFKLVAANEAMPATTAS